MKFCFCGSKKGSICSSTKLARLQTYKNMWKLEIVEHLVVIMHMLMDNLNNRSKKQKHTVVFGQTQETH